MTRPRGRPPMPSAMSRAIEPVGMTFMTTSGLSPRRMTEPLPNCLSIWARAMSRALSRSSVAMMATFEVLGKLSGTTLGRGSDNSGAPADLWRTSLPVDATVGRTPVRSPGRHAARPGSPAGPSRSARSALLRGDLVLLADGQPHLANRQPGVDRLDRIAPAQRREDVVARHAVGAHRPELTVEAGPELLQAHTTTLTRQGAHAPQRP